jgi:hypothetical protein
VNSPFRSCEVNKVDGVQILYATLSLGLDEFGHLH